MVIRSICLRTALLVAATLSATAVSAQTARPGGQGASAQVMQQQLQLQQLAAERTTLQAENARIKADLQAARRERDSLKAAQESLARRSQGADADLVRAQAERARLEGELAREKQRLEELVQRFRETAGSMREVELERTAKTQALAQAERELKVCVDHNSKLYALGTEVIGKLEDQGFWSAVARREPFTRLKKVELENLADGYRQAAADQLIAPSPSGTAN